MGFKTGEQTIIISTSKVEDIHYLVYTYSNTNGNDANAEELPEGWTKHEDGEEGKCYYWHAKRNITQWGKPTGEQLLEGPTENVQGEAPADLPPGWVAHWNEENQSYYYSKKGRRESQWEVPQHSEGDLITELKEKMVTTEGM